MTTARSHRFLLHMEKLVGTAEASLLTEAIGTIPPKSVRFNSNIVGWDSSILKTTGSIVPWCSPFGRYWEKDILPSRTLEYGAGYYYIQEASAMLPIALAMGVIDFKGKIVLDLAAAPGGKTTQAAEYIKNGYIVANEVIPKRSEALVWNVNRHRLNNVIITSQPTGKLAKELPGFFDIIIVDAPCSGEGLFMKRKHSLDEWSEKNVRLCARRQTGILEDALTLLKPGGYIIYSTCTFSREENEDQVHFLLKSGCVPAALPADIQVSGAIDEKEAVQICARRIFPHREGGAGAFVAILQKSEGIANETSMQYEQSNFSSFPVKTVKNPVEVIRTGETEGYFFEKNGVVSYFSYNRVPQFLYREGIQLGAPILDKRKGPAFMYGSIQLRSDEAIVEIDNEKAEGYIGGKDLGLDVRDGLYWVSYNGIVLGMVNVLGKKAINMFPKALTRI